MNTTQIIGRLGRDVDFRVTGSGKEMARFSVAVDKRRKDQNLPPDWYEVVCWGRMATAASEKLQKGSFVFVAGRFQARQWEDRDGNKRTSWELNAEFMAVDFVGAGASKQREQGQEHGNEARPPIDKQTNPPDDEIPF